LDKNNQEDQEDQEIEKPLCPYRTVQPIEGARETFSWYGSNYDKETSAMSKGSKDPWRTHIAQVHNRLKTWVKRNTNNWPTCKGTGDRVRLDWKFPNHSIGGGQREGTVQMVWACPFAKTGCLDCVNRKEGRVKYG
jgi:hypothetical protein